MKNIIILVGIGAILVFLFGVLKVQDLIIAWGNGRINSKGFWAGLNGRMASVTRGELNFES